MTRQLHLAAAFVIAATIGVVILPAEADDLREVSSYVLTEAGLSKFRQATENLSAVPGACEGLDDDGDDDDDESSGKESLDQLAAKLDAVPGAPAAIQSAGMTTREYVVFMFSVMQSGMSAWALDQGGKLAPGVSQANVDFYRKHEAAMAAIGQDDRCDDDSNDADDEENT